MKRKFFNLYVLILLFNIIFSHTQTNKKPNTNVKDNKSKSKELDISEEFNCEVFYRLGIFTIK